MTEGRFLIGLFSSLEQKRYQSEGDGDLYILLGVNPRDMTCIEMKGFMRSLQRYTDKDVALFVEGESGNEFFITDSLDVAEVHSGGYLPYYSTSTTIAETHGVPYGESLH